MIWKRLRLTLEMIKFEHSVFALPFALTGALLAFREGGYGTAGIVAETALDRGGDGGRALRRHGVQPAGGCRDRRAQSAHQDAAICPPACSARGFAWGFVAVASALFCAWPPGELNPLCLMLAPVALAVVFFYSFTKRFTSFSHLVLGFRLGIAPAAAWIAVRGSLDPRILLAHRRGHLLDRRLRRHLLLPGLRIRSRRRPVQRAARARASPAPCAWRKLLHVLMVVCLLALVCIAAPGRARPGRSRPPSPRC